MKLITLLTLGLCGRTKPKVIPIGPKVYKPLIGDVWQQKDYSEWVTPKPETINQIEILNVSRDGLKVLFKNVLINGECIKQAERTVVYKKQHEMTLVLLQQEYDMKHSPKRAMTVLRKDFSKGMRLSDSEFKPLPTAPVFDESGHITNRADFEGSPV